MADIDIVPRRRSYVWLWIIIALVILTVLWFALVGGVGGNRPARVGSVAPQAPAVAVALEASA
jgi:hypothetical protein